MYSRVVKWESVATDYRIFIMRVSENDDLASHLLTVYDFFLFWLWSMILFLYQLTIIPAIRVAETGAHLAHCASEL